MDWLRSHMFHLRIDRQISWTNGDKLPLYILVLVSLGNDNQDKKSKCQKLKENMTQYKGSLNKALSGFSLEQNHLICCSEFDSLNLQLMQFCYFLKKQIIFLSLLLDLQPDLRLSLSSLVSFPSRGRLREDVPPRSSRHHAHPRWAEGELQHRPQGGATRPQAQTAVGVSFREEGGNMLTQRHTVLHHSVTATQRHERHLFRFWKTQISVSFFFFNFKAGLGERIKTLNHQRKAHSL